jgi:hypothetical protein
MSRLGLKAFIDKLTKKDEKHQQAAQALRALHEKNAPVSEFITLLNELKKTPILPHATWLCLTADLLEEEASSAAEKVVGTESDFRTKYEGLQADLYRGLKQVLESFLKRNPMPLGHVEDAIIVDLREYVNDDMPKEYIVPFHFQQAVAKTTELMPQIFRRYGLNDLADLHQQAPEEFKRLKEEGERYLIGMTYEEEFDRSIDNHFGAANE